MSTRLSLKQSSLIIGLFLVVFVTGADSFIISPLLPAIQRSLNITLTQAALAVTVYAVCYAIGAPLLGPLSDQYGHKRGLLAGLALFFVGSTACALVTNVVGLYVFRAVAGLGAAVALPNVWATIGQNFQGKRLGQVMGVTMAALSLSIAIGVPLGTWCAQVTNWRMVFVISAGLTVLIWLNLGWLVTTDHGHRQSARYLQAFKTLLQTRKVWLALAITLTWMLGFYAVYTFLGAFLTQRFKLNTGQVGLIFTAYGLGNFLTSFMSGWVTARLGAMRSVLWNASLSVLAVIGLGLTSGWLPGVIGLLVGLAIFQGCGVPALSTYLVNVAPQQRGTIMAFNSSFLYLGLTLASLIGSFVYVRMGILGICVESITGFILAILFIKVVSKH